VQTDVSTARTPDGRRIEVSAVVAAPPEAAWDLLVDTERWPEWGPSVRAVDADERRIRAGSAGHVVVPGGLRVPYEVTAFDPDGRRWAWSVARVPATGHRVDAVAGAEGPATDRCRVVFEVPLLAAGYVPVCRRALERIAALLRG
jgi:uncharacterized protein YndB with AHSA1/START domain